MKPSEYYRNELCKSLYSGKTLDFFRDLEGEVRFKNLTPNDLRTIVISPEGYALYKHSSQNILSSSVKKKLALTGKLKASLEEDTVLSILTNPRACSNVEEIVIVATSPNVPLPLNLKELQKAQSISKSLNKLRSIVVVKDPIAIQDFIKVSEQAMLRKNKEHYIDIVKTLGINASVIYENPDWYKGAYSLRPKYYAKDEERGTLSNALKRRAEFYKSALTQTKPEKNKKEPEKEDEKEEEPKKVKKDFKEKVGILLNILAKIPVPMKAKASFNKKNFKFITPDQAKTILTFSLVSENGKEDVSDFIEIATEPLIRYIGKLLCRDKDQLTNIRQFIDFAKLNPFSSTENFSKTAERIGVLIDHGFVGILPLDQSQIDLELQQEALELIEKENLSDKFKTEYDRVDISLNRDPDKERSNGVLISLAIAELASKIINNFAPYLESDKDLAKTTSSINKDLNTLNNSTKRFIKEFKDSALENEKEKALIYIEDALNSKTFTNLLEQDFCISVLNQAKEVINSKEDLSKELANFVADFLINQQTTDSFTFNVRTGNTKVGEEISLRGTQLHSPQFYSTGTKSIAVNFNKENNKNFSIYMKYLTFYLSRNLTSPVEKHKTIPKGVEN